MTPNRLCFIDDKKRQLHINLNNKVKWSFGRYIYDVQNKGAHPTGLTRKGVMALITKTIINITKKAAHTCQIQLKTHCLVSACVDPGQTGSIVSVRCY